ncbi:exopolysaccharide biosynthesis polyprenyl glycosylphosphotransferase [Nocardioides sp. KR10-350]
MTTVAVRTGSGPARTVLTGWRSGRGVVALTALLDVGAVMLLALYLVDISPLRSVTAALLWAAVLQATVPSRVGDVHTAVTGVGRGIAVAGLGCWVGGAMFHLPIPERRLVLLLACAAVASLLVRLTVGRAAAPLGVLVVGGAEDRELLAEELALLSGGRLVPLGHCEPVDAAGALADLRPDAVLVVPGPTLGGRLVQRLTWELEAHGVPLLVGTRLHDVAPARTAALRLGQLGLLHVAHPRHAGVRRAVKSLWERTAAALALLLLTPLLLVVAVAIRLDSPGPSLFRQTRVGRAGQPFTMLKFRTMCADAEARLAELQARPDHVLFKLERDPRVTRVGRLLRRYSLDELPQLVNVVRGEMALVGPRPALPLELDKYDEDPLRRLAVTPGLTGLWQVSGRSDLSWEDSVRLDLDYVDNWSLGLDLAILLRTVGAVLRHHGAY